MTFHFMGQIFQNLGNFKFSFKGLKFKPRKKTPKNRPELEFDTQTEGLGTYINIYWNGFLSGKILLFHIWNHQHDRMLQAGSQ